MMIAVLSDPNVAQIWDRLVLGQEDWSNVLRCLISWGCWSTQTRPPPGWRQGSGLTGSSQCCNTTDGEGLSLN